MNETPDTNHRPLKSVYEELQEKKRTLLEERRARKALRDSRDQLLGALDDVERFEHKGESAEFPLDWAEVILRAADLYRQMPDGPSLEELTVAPGPSYRIMEHVFRSAVSGATREELAKLLKTAMAELDPEGARLPSELYWEGLRGYYSLLREAVVERWKPTPSTKPQSRVADACAPNRGPVAGRQATTPGIQGFPQTDPHTDPPASIGAGAPTVNAPSDSGWRESKECQLLTRSERDVFGQYTGIESLLGECTVREAYEHLKEQIEGTGLRSFSSWSRHLGRARRKLKMPKNRPRSIHRSSRSVVDMQDLAPEDKRQLGLGAPGGSGRK